MSTIVSGSLLGGRGIGCCFSAIINCSATHSSVINSSVIIDSSISDSTGSRSHCTTSQFLTGRANGTGLVLSGERREALARENVSNRQTVSVKRCSLR